MVVDIQKRTSSMARLTIAALEKASKDPSVWSEPAIHSAILVSGLSVLVATTHLLNTGFESD